MASEYFYVNKQILPDYLDKVILARELLENHEATTVTEATEKVGISRNTYYKYKDYVFRASDSGISRHAVLSIILADAPGALSAVLSCLSQLKTSILTISQAIPIAGKANLLLSLDISQLAVEIDELMTSLEELPLVKHVHLDALE